MDMQQLGVWEPYAVKLQTIQTAVESATLLLRIDDIVSGLSKKDKAAPGQARAPQTEDPDQVQPRFITRALQHLLRFHMQSDSSAEGPA